MYGIEPYPLAPFAHHPHTTSLTACLSCLLLLLPGGYLSIPLIPSCPFVLHSVSVGFQWLLTWWLFRDDDWQLRKSGMRSLYDGTGFYKLADRNGSPWAGMATRRDAVHKHHMG